MDVGREILAGHGHDSRSHFASDEPHTPRTYTKREEEKE